MKLIVGHSGLVGSTLCSTEKYDHYFNSSNMDTFNQVCQDGAEVILTCLPATKWQVNKNIPEDLKNIEKIISTLSKHRYSKVTLISTIDVYKDSPLLSNESYINNISRLEYGSNRYLFELLVRECLHTTTLNIIRLPALFSRNIKKNIIYDLLHDNNTDIINTNSSYQWYNLENLSKDIVKYTTMHPDREVFNFFTEPLETKELLTLFEKQSTPIGKFLDRVDYNYTTTLTEKGYLYTKEDIIYDIKKLINGFRNK